MSEYVPQMQGPYDGAGADIRRALIEKHRREEREQLMQLAIYEDQLLLATIKNALENPKYGF
jgi:hypothetical protein